MSNGDTVKAQPAALQIGELAIEGYMLPDGSYRMSQTQVAECIGLSERNARDFLRSKAVKSLLGEGYTPAISQIEVESEAQTRGQTRFNALPLEAVCAYWQWQAFRGNKTALGLCMALMLESLERRFDAAFNVDRSEADYNQRVSERIEQLEQTFGDAYAFADDAAKERDEFLRLLQENGIDPYGIPGEEESQS
ncbi:MAG: hypothetical protein ACTS2F_27565 [Thainema sp.]